ncbi:MAG TPA: thioesterase family protein [Ignavibacteriaceae bacterium]|nr:thioesterase family protein [Ignavibacteriaceae bacterium]
MKRIKISLPGKFHFKTEIPIRITDINYGGHLGNDKILSLVQEARVRYLKSFGYSEMNVEGFGIIMVDASVEYKSEVFYGDIILIEVEAADFDKFGFDIFYKLINKEFGKEIARVKTGILIYDYSKKKIMPVPDNFLKKIRTITQ